MSDVMQPWIAISSTVGEIGNITLINITNITKIRIVGQNREFGEIWYFWDNLGQSSSSDVSDFYLQFDRLKQFKKHFLNMMRDGFIIPFGIKAEDLEDKSNGGQ